MYISKIDQLKFHISHEIQMLYRSKEKKLKEASKILSIHFLQNQNFFYQSPVQYNLLW